MPANALNQWIRDFSKAAKADKLALFRDHLKRLGLPDEPELLLQGTIEAVTACCAYLNVDGRPVDKFLAMQRYNPADALDAEYALTFDLCRKAYARLLAPRKKMLFEIDLADLYGHPWMPFKVCGYFTIMVSRVDGRALTDTELEMIEKAVTEDLRYDYPEDELSFWFDPDSIEGVMAVTVQDVEA
jgi:hypothetical protein